MDKLNIDFKGLLPYIVDAFTAVYGEEYRTIISQKVNKTLIISYHDVEGIEGYVRHLRRCKEKECGIRFLERIGIKVKYAKDNFTKSLDSGAQNILENMIGGVTLGFSINADDFSPLRAFDSNNRRTPEYLLENKIKLINYFLGDSEVNKENFDDFTKTDDYLKLLKAINEYRKVYEELLEEYISWGQKLSPYEEYLKQEYERKDAILVQKKKELFEEIFDKLPLALKNALLNKTIEEQMNIILGLEIIGEKSRLEYFQKENMEQLESDDFDLSLKPFIIWRQADYFNDLGITIPDNILDCDSEEDIDKYLEFLNQDYIKQYIPSEELIKEITALREMKYEEAIREYYTTREDFVNAMKIFDSDYPENIEYVYQIFKNKTVCIFGNLCVNDKGEFIPIMFYTVKYNAGGCLFFYFAHENGHIIDQNEKGCGFELAIDFSLEGRKNPYDKAYRKYEKFNETLNDMFTLEAIKFLHNQGIYLMEEKKITILDDENFNTALITKNLLKPLVQNFREQVIKAKINACPEELIRYIGEDNFENLVDAVNKVDYLSRNGVIPKIEESPEDEMVVEYLKQVDRVKKIYRDIDKYYNEHFGELMDADLCVNKTK